MDRPSLYDPRRRRGIVLATLLVASLLYFGICGLVIARHLRDERAGDAEAVVNAATTAYQYLVRIREGLSNLQWQGELLFRLRLRGRVEAEALIAEEIRRTVSTERLRALQLSIVDGEGWLIWSSVIGYQRLWLGDREHFRVYKEGRKAPFVSRPVLGRASNRWSIQFVRPLLPDQPEFSGIVVVSVDLEKLERDLATFTNGRLVDLAVLRPDGEVLFSSSDGPSRGSMIDLGRCGDRAAVLRGVTDCAVEGTDVEGTLFFFRGSGLRPPSLLDVLGSGYFLVAFAVYLALASLVRLVYVQRARAEATLEGRIQASRAEQVTAERDRLEGLLAAVPAGVYIAEAGPAGRMTIDYVSRSLQQVIGTPTATAWWDRVHALGGTAGTIRRDISALPVGATASWVYPVRNEDGREVWLREIIRMDAVEETGEKRLLGFLTDVTREQEREARARTAAKLSLLGEIAASLAHELNQPIAVMSMAAENALHLLRSESPDAKLIASKQDRIIRQAKRASSIIHHLRVFGRADEGAVDAVDLREVVQLSLDMTGHALRLLSIEVQVELPDDLPPVLARRVMLEQVFVNLLLNARDILEERKVDAPVIRIEARAEAATGKVLVEILDNGGGIPDAVLPHLFEPFFTTKAAGKGTGLGLAICATVMAEAGGAIEASNGDGGACFRLVLKMAEGA